MRSRRWPTYSSQHVARSRAEVLARFGAVGLLLLKLVIVGGTWALTWPLARRHPAQLPRPLALIVAFCCVLVAGAVALDVATLVGWRVW